MHTTKTIQCGACTVHIHRPELTEAERKKREQAIMQTVGGTMRAYLQRKEATA